MRNPWAMYEELIEGIPADLTVEDVVIGLNWTCVTAGGKAGLAMTFRGGSTTGISKGSITGRSLKDAAALAKSWNMIEASAGMAAINAYYNTEEKMAELGVDRSFSGEKTGTGVSIFNEPLKFLTGKKVAVIGHFPYIERQLGDKCALTILEREPEETDTLDSACEYLLPEQDVVFITGMTFTNKTLPRLLELTERARTVLVGPSAPMAPLLARYGVNSVAGFYATDPSLARSLVAQAAHFEVFQAGRRITLPFS